MYWEQVEEFLLKVWIYVPQLYKSNILYLTDAVQSYGHLYV